MVSAAPDRPSPEPRVPRERLSVPMPTGGARKVTALTAPMTPSPTKVAAALSSDEERPPESRRETFVPTTATPPAAPAAASTDRTSSSGEPATTGDER